MTQSQRKLIESQLTDFFKDGCFKTIFMLELLGVNENQFVYKKTKNRFTDQELTVLNKLIQINNNMIRYNKIPKKTKIMQGLYYYGNFVTKSYEEAIKIIFQCDQIPENFVINADYEALGYSVIDKKGIQYIYELDHKKFYEKLMSME